MTVNGYTITGDNYFFLNFYQLPIVNENQASGQGLNRGFPKFEPTDIIYNQLGIPQACN